MTEDTSIRPDLVPQEEWDDSEDNWGSWGSWKGSENAGWNDEEYDVGCGDGCDDDSPPPPLTHYTSLGGSSSKWKPGEFDSITTRFAPTFKQEGSLGLIDGDDSVVMHVNNGQAIVFSIDWFTPVVDDYYQFGAISAASALSGLYAAGVKPITALNVMALPCKLGVEVVGEVVRGGSDKVIEAGAFVVGGHSIDDDTPKYGLAAFGVAPAESIIRNERIEPGDVVFYTKPLGSGIIAEAYRAERETEESMQEAVDSMLELNKAAADAMKGLDVHGASRVAEQGLAGHLHMLLEAGNAAAAIQWNQLALLPRVREHAQAGCIPVRTAETAAWAEQFVSFEGERFEAELCLSLLCDPQTSGGLLVVLPEKDADTFASAFQQIAGHAPSRIGRITNGATGTILVSQ